MQEHTKFQFSSHNDAGTDSPVSSHGVLDEIDKKCGPEKLTEKIQRMANYPISLIEGSLEVKLPTIWTVEKQRWEESEEKRSEERRCRCAKR